MMCYKDRTWCSFYEDCKHVECKIRLTHEVKQAAEKWWGSGDGAPISVYVSKPDCWEPVV